MILCMSVTPPLNNVIFFFENFDGFGFSIIKALGQLMLKLDCELRLISSISAASTVRPEISPLP